MRRLVTTAAVLMLWGVSGATLFSVLSGTPAFNATLREENVFGGQQLQNSAAMYEEPAYLFQVGTSYLRADLLTSSETGAASDYAPIDMALFRAELARDLFSLSVEDDPANAHAWTSLAWAETLIGETDAARAALRRSWRLAPYNRQLAERRASLFEVLYAPDIPELSIDPSTEEQTAFTRDLSTLQRFDQASYEAYSG